MKLMTLEYLRKQKALKNRTKTLSRRKEGQLTLELKEKLDQLLFSQDRCLLEINKKYLGEFMNILSEDMVYGFEQVDANKFIFFNKEVTV